MSAETLKLKSVSFKHHGKYLVKDISLFFETGQLYGIIGPNGSGKSTLLKTMCGIWQPSCGQVIWNDGNLLELDRKSISRVVTLVPQQANPTFDFTVSDMVIMGLYSQGRSADMKYLQECLEKVDAWHLRNRCIKEISHGERQRVYIARALMTRSPILLLDEPTANLDISHQLAIWALLRQLVDEKKIIIVTSHDLIATEKYCDHISILHSGNCIATGKYGDVMQDEVLEEVFGVVEGPVVASRQFILTK